MLAEITIVEYAYVEIISVIYMEKIMELVEIDGRVDWVYPKCSKKNSTEQTFYTRCKHCQIECCG